MADYNWRIARSHIPASELSTSAPWIPETLYIEAAYYKFYDDFIEFKDSSNVVVYSCHKDFIREIARMDSNIHQCEPSIALTKE